MTSLVKERFLIEAAFVEEKGTSDIEKVIKGEFFGEKRFSVEARFSYQKVISKEDL